MERVHEISEKVSRFTVHVSGGLLILSAFLVAIEVVSRKVFSYSLTAVDEVSGYIFGITTAWALSYALFQRAHIRIDALYVRLPVKACCVLDIVALASLAIVFSMLAYQTVGVLAESLHLGATSNTPLRTPLWMPQILWLGGLWFFVFNIYILLIRAAQALLHGNFYQLRAIAGAPSVFDEVGEEVHHVTAASRCEPAADAGDR